MGKLASDAEELIINRARRGRGRGRASKTEVADRTRTEEPVSTTNTRWVHFLWYHEGSSLLSFGFCLKVTCCNLLLNSSMMVEC